LPIINETKSPTKGAKKVQDARTQVLEAMNIPKMADRNMNENNQVLEPSPPIVKNILNKERGRTLERMPSLDKPSPIITTHLKIKVVYAPYNATDTLYM
jgi:hypothetical protein